ncbi:hypothetical protein ACHHYP_14425 [Achlya hypogyna]|uniref:MARVEL domain-containing protein n=1 Tax=Achlya hypogyna TaxID=1202772 RepID=A0A1V9YD45_ACHHY|nr:hypothetical protein ACHHYP_14425 [Achlya hypogyna]
MDSISLNKAQLEMVLRGAQGLCALITFGTSTVVTGIAAGDFAFLVSYNMLAFAILYVVFVLYQKKVTLSLKTTAIMDATGGLFVFVAAIWLIASKAFAYCHASSCGGAYACVVFLFVGTFIQAAAVYLAYIQLYRRRDTEEPTTIESPTVLQ